MQADLSAPRSALAERLRRLVEAGLLDRKPYREPGSRTRHAYILSAKGRDLAPVFLALTAWGETHVTGKVAPVAVYDAETSRELRVAFADEEGTVVPTNRARLRPRF